jgi:type VI secretion system ImpC/EvpB family protein
MSAAEDSETVLGPTRTELLRPAAASDAIAPRASSLLDRALQSDIAVRDTSDETLRAFLAESDRARQLELWLGEGSLRRWNATPRKVAQHLERDLARIDRLISEQLSSILHHPAFQKLEASWRGLEHLVLRRDETGNAQIQVRVWNVSWKMLRDDLEGAIEFDQSFFFRKIYEEGLGTPGATPFSALLLDFDIQPRPNRLHPYDDIAMLRSMSETAAAAFAPLFVNAHPSMFNVDSYTELRQSLDFESMHQSADFLRWQRFRETEDARFVTVLLPRILMRSPYRPECRYDFGFRFEEETQSSKDYLWGNSTWAMGEVLIRNFHESGWFAAIRGMERGVVAGGVALGPAQHAFETEPHRIASKPITEVVITDQFERQLAKLGFAPLCASKYGSEAVFYSIPSVQKPKRYNTPEASANAEISAMTNYILSASRFGHYIKVITRDKVGGFLEAYDIQSHLSDWLIHYVNRDPDAGPESRAAKPLLDADVQVRAKPNRPGEYDCIIQMEPFHGFDDIRASVRLDTRIVPPHR